MKNNGFGSNTIVSFESRQADIMEAAIRGRGGVPISAPSMKEVPLGKHTEVFEFGKKLLYGEIDQIIFMTGVGVKMMFKILESQFNPEDIFGALKKTRNIVRGPKPKKALYDLKLPIHLVIEEPNTWREILETIDSEKDTFPIQDKHIAVQEYGKSNEELLKGLVERGARVLQVPIYKWELPDDVRPLEKAIDLISEGRAAGTVFTSAQQIRHVLQIAEKNGLKARLLEQFKHVVVGSVGPVTTEALEENGLRVDFEPSHPKMGTLIKEFSEQFEELAKSK